MNKFILASGSPRRKSLLEESGYVFSVDHVKVSEIINENLNVRENAEALARQKAEAYIIANKHLKSGDNFVLSADTLVAFKGLALGKPKNISEAIETLTKLSGKTHSVITAFCIYSSRVNKFYTFSEETKVWFKNLERSQIEEYVETKEPLDKAGSYAIQGKAHKFVDKIEGSMTNVIGLPMELLEKVIKENGWKLPRK